MKKHSKNWAIDKIKKCVIYNLNDFSQLIIEANNAKQKHILIDKSIFPFKNDSEFGYSFDLYEGKIRGIATQLKNGKFEVEIHEEIKEIKKYLA